MMTTLTTKVMLFGLKAKATMSEIGSPPLSRDIETGDEDVKGTETDSWITNAHFGIIGLVALAALGSGLLSFFAVTNQLADLASVCLIVVAPLTLYQKAQLTKLGGFRAQHNELRKSISKFSAENDKLVTSVDELQREVQSLSEVKDQLSDIAKTSGAQVSELVEVVHEYGVVQQEIKNRLKENTMQTILEAMMNSDSDRDNCVDQSDIQNLLFQLKCIRGIVVDEQKFREKLHSNGSEVPFEDVMRMVEEVMNDDQDDGFIEFRTSDLMSK